MLRAYNIENDQLERAGLLHYLFWKLSPRKKVWWSPVLRAIAVFYNKHPWAKRI